MIAQCFAIGFSIAEIVEQWSDPNRNLFTSFVGVAAVTLTLILFAFSQWWLLQRFPFNRSLEERNR